MKWTMSRFLFVSAVVAIVAFIGSGGLVSWIHVSQNKHFPMEDGVVTVNDSEVFPVGMVEQSGVQPSHQEDPFSLHLRQSLNPGSAWQYSNRDWCLQCQTDGQNETCLDGGKIVIGRCSEDRPQLFTYEETGPGEGRLKPTVDPDLCLTIFGSGQAATLSRCLKSNSRQLFDGLEGGHAFELRAKDDPNLCLVAHRSNQAAFVLARCSKALYQLGRNTRQTQSCPRTCLDVYQREKREYVGQFDPVATSQSVDQFYRYNADNRFGYNGEEITPLDADTSIIFIHQDATNCDLALVTVHGAKELKDGQECRPGRAVLFITGDLEDSVVQDGRNSPSDSFTYDPDTDETKCDWTWSWQRSCEVRTDGLAHWWDPDELPCIKIRPDGFSGIDRWMYVPGEDESDETISFDEYVRLDMDDDLEICLGECN
jgi:hypothetical protein